jgi:hypothetical protein
MMAIEARLNGSSTSFTDFAHKVEITLHSIAAALRGSRVGLEALPNLREAYKKLAESGHNLSDETDRLTNSVNTLAEHVLRFSLTRTPVRN